MAVAYFFGPPCRWEHPLVPQHTVTAAAVVIHVSAALSNNDVDVVAFTFQTSSSAAVQFGLLALSKPYQKFTVSVTFSITVSQESLCTPASNCNITVLQGSATTSSMYGGVCNDLFVCMFVCMLCESSLWLPNWNKLCVIKTLGVLLFCLTPI